MTLKIYNTLSRKKEEFIPVDEGKVKMYVCGLTVYSDAHIGHSRTYYAFDVIRRYFEYKGFNVRYVQNITDVDDKIINAANRENVDALDYSRRFADRCLEDLDDLGIRRADLYPKASETIPSMIEMINKILENGFGYESQGDVYFSVEKFRKYGKLSGQNIEDLISGTRIDPSDNKRSSIDFALWKKAKPGEPFWDSPWGKGRPGWHIECSAMSSKYLGLPFDIHGGGMDLRFPHHENEIAQAESATGKNFANYWIHVGLLTVDGEKMSKSIGNIVNIKDLLTKWDPEVIRFFFAQAHYRSPPDFNDNGLKNTQKGLLRIHRLGEKLEKLSKSTSNNLDEDKLTDIEKRYLKVINDFENNFVINMDDDFNTPGAVANIFDFVNKSNKFLNDHPNPNKSICKYALDIFLRLGNVLTLFHEKQIIDDTASIDKLQNLLSGIYEKTDSKDLNELMEKILTVRTKARLEKNWSVSDNIRDELDKIGFEIQDTDSGPIWRKK